MIYKIDNYYGDKGEHIRECVLIDGEKPEDFVRFSGIGRLLIETPMGNMPQEFNVPIEAESIIEAFEKFDKIMEEKAPEAVEEIKKAMMKEYQDQQSRIITPNG